NGVAVLLYNLKTEAFLETQQPDSAAYWNNKALAYPLSADYNASWQMTALAYKARILDAAGRYTEASEYLLQAWDIAENASVKDKAKLSNEIAVNLFRRNHTVAAKNWFQQTLGFFKTDTLNCYPDYNVTTAMFGLALCYEVQQQIDSCSYW